MMDKETADYIEDVRSDAFADGRRQGAEEFRERVLASIDEDVEALDVNLKAASEADTRRLIEYGRDKLLILRDDIASLPLTPEDSNE